MYLIENTIFKLIYIPKILDSSSNGSYGGGCNMPPLVSEGSKKPGIHVDRDKQLLTKVTVSLNPIFCHEEFVCVDIYLFSDSHDYNKSAQCYKRYHCTPSKLALVYLMLSMCQYTHKYFFDLLVS